MIKHEKHSPAELSDALEHVIYEIWKYRQSVADFAPIFQVGGDVAIEFRVLHHRVLLEFFYGPAGHKDSVAAWEYTGNWSRFITVPTFHGSAGTRGVVTRCLPTSQRLGPRSRSAASRLGDTSGERSSRIWTK